jgi:hypothetical protein
MGGGELRPTRILIIGGSYGGLAAAVTLLDLFRGKISMEPILPNGLDTKMTLPVDIKLVDERDGFCRCHPFQSRKTKS